MEMSGDEREVVFQISVVVFSPFLGRLARGRGLPWPFEEAHFKNSFAKDASKVSTVKSTRWYLLYAIIRQACEETR